MSDIEDIDHEPENNEQEGMHLEEEHPEQEMSAPAGHAPEEPFDEPGFRPGHGAMLKIAAALVVVLVGGGYFFWSSHHAKTPLQMAESPAPEMASRHAPATHIGMGMPVKTAITAQNEKTAAAPASVWNGAPASTSAPASEAAPRPAEAVLPIPAAIPPAANNSVTPPAAPTIVNEPPPSSAQLTDVGGAPPPPAAMGLSAPSAPAAPMPGSDMLAGMPPPAPSAAAPAPSAGAATGMPAAPTQAQQQPQKQTSHIDIGEVIAPQGQLVIPVAKPEIKNGQPMPSAVVPPVAKAELNKKAGMTGKTETGNMAPAADTAKVEALEKEIGDLKQTINQLQQTPVEKEQASGEKAAEEEANTEDESPAAAPVHHKTSHHKALHRKTAHAHKPHHVAAVKWVLKAAKPGVAWVARKGSEDLHMVETGDSLTGIGRVTGILRNSSGYWVVNGTKGRISQ